jgi:hypothetical protein
MKFFILVLLLFSCSHPAPEIKKYERSEWTHWSDENRNCLDTRSEILKSRSLTPVLLNKKGCKVVAGKWEDFYYPEVHTLASTVDIDHVVPLKNAHLSGGANWSNRSKEEFANDFENLVITNRSYNRKKGSKGIDQWLPVGKDYACKYAKLWREIKNRYSLMLLPAEQETLSQLRSECFKLGIKI